jgi:hypothetical protein
VEDEDVTMFRGERETYERGGDDMFIFQIYGRDR